MTEETALTPHEQEREALKRIALTGDGLLLHRYLRRVLESRTAVGEYGALSRREGARILAGDLMALMAEGIESNRAGSSSADNPILTRASGGTVVGASRTGRRVALEPGDGWTAPSDTDTGGSTGTS